MLSDGEIVRRVNKGRSDEFRQLVTRHQRSALTLAYRMLGNHDEAEDAVQDAFVKVFKSLDTFAQGSAFWPWLRRTVINCCIRRMSNITHTDDIDTLLDAKQPKVESAEIEVLRKCDSQELRSAIKDLPFDYRNVLVLRYQEDLSTPEIAQALGVSAGAVRVRLHRALRMLAERLAVIQVEM